MKKTIYLLLAAILAASMLAGCTGQNAQGAFTAQNEIVTYEKIDKSKTQLVISRTGNIDVENICNKFEERNPDVQIIYLDITGGTTGCTPVIDWIKNGYSPDIMISTAGFFNTESTVKYFENLSADPIIENYEAAALKRTATNANIYWLPGPSNINAIAYNKTLFTQYGWEVPKTFDEFVALCNQIREDTNGEVEPWNPNAKYSNELQTAIEAFTYEELFGGADNRAWYNDFTAQAENATFAGHMEPFYAMLQTLIDNDILREEHFSYSATTRGKEFTSGKIAMINVVLSDFDNDQYDYGYMPFPTTKGELGYICDSFSCFVGVPKKEHTDKEKLTINRFLNFFSSVEGQQLFIGGSLKFSNVKGVPLNQSDDLATLQPAIAAGHMFELLDFESVSGKSLNTSTYTDSYNMTIGTKTAAECIADTDANPYSRSETKPVATPKVIATVNDNMTILETSFYIADAYRETMGADIGLIANNVAYRGNLMRMFAGSITPPFVNVLKPRSFENGSKLEKITMTGQQLLDALNYPPNYDERVENCIYAYSGLKCEIAPWNELGTKYISVKLADGSQVDPAKLYTVAVWDGTVADEYITEVVETHEGSFEEILTAKLKADGTIVPANDGRIKLIWS